MDQQLVARIKRRSKYWGQTTPNQWFDVRVVEDTYYRLRGNNNNYRLDDVIIGVRLANGFIVDLVNGKISRGRKPDRLISFLPFLPAAAARPACGMGPERRHPVNA